MNLSPNLENYLEQNMDEEPNLLRLLRRETYQKTTQPHMISGILQGRILSMLSKIISPKLIVEIGTFTGYSTLCLAEGLRNDGEIITIDKNKETAYLSKKYFMQSEYNGQIKFIEEDAMIALASINKTIDLVFLDADKERYADYVDAVKPFLNRGGIILADNILWKGKVASDAKDKKTESIKAFNKKIKDDKDWEVVILPIRDGISVIRKK